MKPVHLRPLAEEDLVGQARHYQRAGGEGVASRFVDSALAALRAIEEMPGIGSPRIGELIGIDGLRRMGVEGFPCGWLYLDRPEVVDVIRMLADRQDVEFLLGQAD